jgi:ribosomal protein L11 methyltransferase
VTLTAFRVTVPGADEDVATALLYGAGTTGIEVQPGASGTVGLLAYFADEVSGDDVARSLEALPSARVEPAVVPEVDWVARFRETFHRFEAGGFTIAPPWDRPERRGNDGDVILVDPGRAFGTGTHETTRLCLGALRSLHRERPLGRVLDVGTGTGILAIAASRLGASSATGVDLDPDSIASARLHAAMNDVPLWLVRADGGRPFRSGAFDTVVANLSTSLLRSRRSEILFLAASSSVLVLSGMLAEDASEVGAAYEAAGAQELLTDGEWACLVFRSAGKA